MHNVTLEKRNETMVSLGKQSSSDSRPEIQICNRMIRPVSLPAVQGIVDGAAAYALACGNAYPAISAALTTCSTTNVGRFNAAWHFAQAEHAPADGIYYTWLNPVADQAFWRECDNVISLGSIAGFDLTDHQFKGLRVAGQLILALNGYWLSGRISEEVANAGRAILDSYPSSLPFPQLSVSEEGELGLSWFSGDNRVEAMIDPDDRRIYWIGKFSGKFIEGEDQDLPDTTPPLLLRMLARLFG